MRLIPSIYCFDGYVFYDLNNNNVSDYKTIINCYLTNKYAYHC